MTMKKGNKIGMLGCFIFAVGLLISCEEDDSKKEWGFAKVYMPQAALVDGGITHNYPVPFNSSNGTQNYELDEENNLLHITLGVYRSGLQALESFSVKVATDNTATATAVANTTKGAALPQDCYAIPGEVIVPNGERETIFKLTVDLGKLIAEHGELGKRQLIAVIALSNPSKYELNEALAKTTVIIDASRFMPTPPPQYGPELISGGDFEGYTDITQKWMRIKQLANTSDDNMATIDNGRLKIRYPVPVRCGMAVCQTVTLEGEKEYAFSADLSMSGQSSSGGTFQFLTLISTTIPPENGNISSLGTYSATGNFYAWMGTFANSGAGNIYRTTTDGILPVIEGIHTNMSTGRFIAPASYTGKTVYVTFAFFSSDANGDAGIILIDNVSLREYIAE
ncbi:hypothetical protein FACS1894182_08590 [Bacteroidia bacterium]|nr:hypothetical protein FACS1894182_08590 [Bacteroidia bacterium]